MNKTQAEERIKKLKKEIAHHRYLYHVLDKHEISDAALDSLKNELFKLEQAYPELITSDSPTQRIGGQPLEKFNKVKHRTPMLSLFDAFSPQDMADWEKRICKILPDEKYNYYCELKLDGLAGALTYHKGIFFQGATRGDGKVGEDVTSNLKTIESVPLKLRQPTDVELKKQGLAANQINKINQAITRGTIEVRGETIMTKKVFAKLNKRYTKQGKPVLANPRNAAAGSIRQLDPKLAAARMLDFYAYALETDLGLTTHEQEIKLLRLLGFKTLKQSKYCQNLEIVIKFHNQQEINKDKLPFYNDGVVVKVNKLNLWSKLGVVGKGPRYMMAYKFAAEQATTRLKDVVWQVGRTGILTPTAVLDPVRVGGVTVSHATLHNMDEIKRLGLKIGDTVILERAGDVIPKIVKALLKLRTGQEKAIQVPRKCPMCDSGVERVPGEVAYRCTNTDCYAVNLRRLTHFASKGALDIEGLGPKIIEQLMKEGLVADIADFYALTAGDLKPLERFADKSTENLVESINDKREVELGRFLFGLGIRHVGEESALLLAQRIMNYELRIKNKKIELSDLFRVFKNIKLEDFEKINDIGPIVAKSICEWWHEEKNIKILKKFEKNGVKIIAPVVNKKSQVLAGQSIVLTGSLSSLTREQAKAKIRELGGQVSSSVSKNTDLVVAGEEPGSKYDKAKKLGVRIVDEVEFFKIIK